MVAFFPIYWIVSTSFKVDTQWFAWPPVYFPDPPTLANYLNVWLGKEEYTTTQYAISSQKPLYSLRNSIVIATTSTLLAVLFGSVIAYGVSRYRILSEARMFQLLMLRMIPPIVVVAPLSLYYSALGLLDTMFGLILIYFITSLPYAVWMTKSFIDEVPREIEQAAELLGASRWRTIFEIVLPLIRSGLVATFLFILILTWSEYLLAFILTKTEVATLPIELSKYQGSTEGRVYGRQAALAVGITVPLMIVGLIIRKHLARGFSFGMVTEIALARIELVNLTKTFGSVVAVNESLVRDRGRRVRGVRRAVGLRQDHDAAHDRRLRGSDLGRDPHRRPRGQRHRAARPRARHGVPDPRAVPAQERGAEHRVRAAHEEGAARGARASACARSPRWCASPTCSTRCRASARAASRSASRSPAPWSPIRPPSCSTSRCRASTPSCGASCAPNATGCTRCSSAPSSSSPTTRKRR